MKLLKTIAVGLLLITAPVFAADAPNATAQNEATALGIISTIDKAEVSAANLALSKNPPKPIEEYAKFLKTEHGKNLIEAQQLIKKLKLTSEPSADVQNLQQQTQAEADKLSALTGSEFNTAYINAMVQGHKDALKTIDEKILPSITNKTLKNFVSATRKHVAMHLKRAEAIQKALPAQTETTTTAMTTDTVSFE